MPSMPRRISSYASTYPVNLESFGSTASVPNSYLWEWLEPTVLIEDMDKKQLFVEGLRMYTTQFWNRPAVEPSCL